MKKQVCVILMTAAALVLEPTWEHGHACTSIMVGKKASTDGSGMTSHTCDSHRTRGWLDITASRQHKEDSKLTLVKRTTNDSLAMPTYKYVPTGDIPQVPNTYGYINTAYPCMNEYQLAIGE